MVVSQLTAPRFHIIYLSVRERRIGDAMRIFTLIAVRTLNSVRNAHAHEVTNSQKTIQQISDQRPGDQLLRNLMRFGYDIRDPAGRQDKFFIVLSALSILWELEFASNPPLNLLGASND